jgi:hypothetical protein
MSIRRGVWGSILAAMLIAGSARVSYASLDRESSSQGLGIARFEGRLLDLQHGWGAARACLLFPKSRTECFRTEAQEQVRERQLAVDPAVSCSVPLRLYDTAFLGGTVVSVFTRGLWINLSAVSFDNRTTSFKVGACAIELASGPGGGGNFYPRCLSPGCVENTMLSGWNNTISSVFLY